MNREILFKAKRKDNGEWVEGCPMIDYVSGQYFIHQNGNSVNESPKIGEEGCLRFLAFEIDPNTLCQYTGLTDKNGNKIWENDIVSAWSTGSHAIGKVTRRVDGLYFMYPAYQNNELWVLCSNQEGKITVEVIGNIFDNEELMEVEQ